ncbi:uncharacterized protein At1g27050 [Primulina huaijiensis]|uniref:uncharacterized protein At1g27050 n=1 Tax=Primulina huaijiensis TaxID=1492673 RepID=UPI003CC71156
MNSRKREKPYPSRHAPYSFPKRRRPLPLDATVGVDEVDKSSSSATSEKPQTTVVVIGVPSECSVLDLKSRFEIYGPISRTRMDPNGLAYVSFRSNDVAQSAVAAARDPDFPITLNSVPVQVIWASDPVSQRRGGVGQTSGLSSKLLRAEVPLSRYGRGNKLGSAIVNPREELNKDSSKYGVAKNGSKLDGGAAIGNSGLDGSIKGREIVAYDDIL